MVEMWLECDSTTTQGDLQSERRFLSLKTGWRNCGWSETQQQHSKHNTKRTKILDVKTCRIFAINIRKRGTIHGEMAKLWLEWDSTTTQQARNKANGDYIWRQNLRIWNEKTDPTNFSETLTKMRSISRRHCGWSGASTTTQKYETGEKTVLKCLFKWARHWVDELVLTLGCVWYQKTSGLPIVGDSKNYTRQ